jgi:hypothetical protein
MTLDEARTLLGVDPTATPEAVKRAYLRLLRTYNPEVDPEGFKRLREAYELVQGHREPVAGYGGWPRPASDAPVPSSFSPEPQSAEEPAPSPTPAREAVLPPIARSSTLEFGSAPPSAATPTDGPPPSVPEPVPTLLEIDGFLARQDLDGAVGALRRIYEAATRSAVVSTPPIRIALDLLFNLHEQNLVDLAKCLEDVLIRWFDAAGVECRLLSGETAALWRVARDLSALPAGLSATARGSIVRLLLGGSWSDELPLLVSHREANPLQARTDARILAEHPHVPGARAVARALGSEFELIERAADNHDSRGTSPPAEAAFRPLVILLAGTTCLGLILIPFLHRRESAWSPPPDPALANVVFEMVDAAPDSARGAAFAQAWRLSMETSPELTGRHSLAPDQRSIGAASVAVYLERDDCANAVREAEQLEKEAEDTARVDRSGGAHFRAEASKLRQLTTAACSNTPGATDAAQEAP